MDNATRAWWLVIMTAACVAVLARAVAIAGLALLLSGVAAVVSESLLFGRDRNRRQ
jgi:hypothetical protein